MKHGLSGPGGLVEGQEGATAERPVGQDHRDIGVAHVERCTYRGIGRGGLEQALIALRNGTIFGEAATGDPASYRNAVLQGEVERRAVGAGLTSRDDLLEEVEPHLSVEPPLEAPVRIQTQALVGCQTLLARIPEYHAGALR